MKENVVKRNWLRILSPAVLGMVICVIGIIISFVGLETSGGWSFLGVIILAPVFGILLAIDFIAKLIIKDKTFFIWIVELLVLLLVYVFWISTFI
jgi:hypothetical protein